MSGKWILVLWTEGGCAVASEKDLVAGSKVVAGETVDLNCGSGVRRGKIVMVSDDFNALQESTVKFENTDKAYPDEPGPSLYEDPEPGDFSPSESSWGPESGSSSDSGDEEVEEDEEEERRPEKDMKVISAKRQYNNKKKTKKIQTPALRAEAVIPKSYNSHKRARQSTQAKKEYTEIHLNKDQITQNVTATEAQIIENTVPLPDVTVSGEELAKVRNDIAQFKEMLKSLKSAVANIRMTLSADHLYETVCPTTKVESQVIRMPNDEANEETIVEEIKEVASEKNDIIINNSFKDPRPVQAIKPIRYGLIKQNTKRSTVNVNTVSPMNKSQNNEGTIVKDKNKYKGAHKQIAEETSNQMVAIGLGKTLIPKQVYEEINWESYTMATRKLLMAVFERRELATHSLTGKASPAFMNKPAKLCLDQKKVQDIILTVSENCRVKESLVRNAITIKCADENKMFRMKTKKQSKKKPNTTNTTPPLRILNNQEYTSTSQEKKEKSHNTGDKRRHDKENPRQYGEKKKRTHESREYVKESRDREREGKRRHSNRNRKLIADVNIVKPSQNAAQEYTTANFEGSNKNVIPYC